jgi:anaphase-promoting complex subunit 1
MNHRYHRPAGAPSFGHAGFLLGLGLAGHLSVLAPSDYVAYLSDKHIPTSVAVLLGSAAAQRGSQDAALSRMLCCHLPSLPPLATLAVDVPTLVQSSVLMGLGLLYVTPPFQSSSDSCFQFYHVLLSSLFADTFCFFNR